MDPADDSFHISPEQRYPVTSKKGDDETLSGLNEFENLGEETTAKGVKEVEPDSKDHSKRSLEKDFEEAAAKYPDELEVSLYQNKTHIQL